MAFTQAPEVSTYGTERIPAGFGIDLRPGSLAVNYADIDIIQDAGMVNFLPVVYEDQLNGGKAIVAETRPAIIGNTITASPISSVLRGIHVWEKSAGTIYYFAVVGTSVYTTTTPEVSASWTVVNTLLTNVATPVRFEEFIDGINTKKLVMVDGVEGYVYTSNAAGTKITDIDFPSPHIPWPVFIDGYLFLARANTGDIYNSDLNNPASWTAGSFISSELYPDDLQAIVKVNNYLLAIGTEGCEYFYDAANSTGSPLARYEGGSLPFGCQIPNSIAVNKNTVIMISNNNDGQSVIKAIEDFKHKDLDSSFVIPILNSRIRNNPDVTASGVRGYFFRQSGKLYYTLKFCGDHLSNDTDVDTSAENPTLVYSFETDNWTEFSYGADGSAAFPVNFSATTSTQNLSTYVAGHVVNAGNNYPFFGVFREGETNPDQNAAVDFIVQSVPIYQEIRTPNLDFKTLNLKAMHRVGVYLELGSPTTNSINFSLTWNDADYAIGQWATPRTLTRTSSSFVFPFVTQLGMFRYRAMKFYHATGYWMRVKFFEFDINKGQQ
jgi:hypothetical protein